MLDKYKTLRTAEKLVLDRKFSQAVGEYQKLLADDPEEPTLLNTVGELLLRQQQPEQALGYFRRVAEIYLKGGFTVKALAMYKKILQVSPQDLKAQETLAELYQKQGLPFEAAREMKSLIDLHESAGRLDQAVTLLKKLTAVVPDDPENWRRRARLLSRQGKKEKAQGNYREAIRFYRARGDEEAVLECAREALEVDPSDHGLLLELVEAGSQTESLDEVSQFLQERVRSSGKEYPYQLFVGMVAERRGQLDEAGEIYQKLQAQGFSDPLISEGLMRTGKAVEFGEGVIDIELDSGQPLFPAEPQESEDSGGPFESGLAAEEAAEDGDTFDLSAPEEEFSFSQPSGVFHLEPGPSWEAPAQEPEQDQEGEDETSSIFGSGLFSVEPEEVEEEQDSPFEAEPGEVHESFILQPPAKEDLFEPEEVEAGEFEDASLRVQSPEIASLDEALEEVDFYLKLGFRDDGKQLLEKLLAQFPGEERVVKRARKILSPEELAAASQAAAAHAAPSPAPAAAPTPEPRSKPTPPPAALQPKAPPAAPPTHQEPAREPDRGDFEEEIETALGGLFAGLDEEGEEDEVLRYDVIAAGEQPVANSDVHYNLGLAYKEMGLLDDAVQEFLKTYEMLKDTPDSPQALLCCSMLANSYLQLGDSREAAQWARTGLKFPEKKDFERKALEYDLALALENLGEIDQAIGLYEGILRRDVEYRDVAQRADQLRTRNNGQ